MTAPLRLSLSFAGADPWRLDSLFAGRLLQPVVPQPAWRVLGPPVSECVDCSSTIPLEFTRWQCSRSAAGKLMALLPYCVDCAEAPESER